MPYAIRYFLDQDYPEKELVIVDDGDDAVADLIPGHAHIRYIRTKKFATLGEKRNYCIAQCSGDYIMHWDDDDWMAPHRISRQMDAMLNSRAAVCGLQQMYFYDAANGRCWLYQYPPGAKPWLAGGSLLYTRSFWKAKPFLHRQVASDTEFIFSRKLTSYHVFSDPSIYIARIHPGNTSVKATAQAWWHAVDTEQITALTGEVHWNELLQIQHESNEMHATTQQNKRVALMITTCHREQQLKELIDSLKQEVDAFSLSFFIQDDSLTANGKQGYWKTMNALWQQVQGQAFDYYIHIQDDALPGKSFIARAIEAWEALRDKKKITLNLFPDASRLGKTCWTGQWAQIHREGDRRYLRTQWMDLFCFICTGRFFDQLGWTIQPIPLSRWAAQPELSSGVGQQLSTRLHQQGQHMYQVTEQLVEHGGDHSRMHPALRMREPLRAATLDPIYAGMASIPGRESQLKKALNSLLPCVDHVFLCLHDVRVIPAWIKPLDKVTVIIPGKEEAHLGDAGKFMGLGQIKDSAFYYFSVDDDMIYPPDYTWKMIAKIEQYQRQCIVSCGGYTMKPVVQHFYNDRVQNCHIALPNPADRPVHILHSGLAAWHSTTLNFSHHDCPLPNMSDLWLALAAQKQDRAMLVTERPVNWVKTQVIPISRTIYGRYRDQCDEQTRVFNSYADWSIRSFAPEEVIGV